MKSNNEYALERDIEVMRTNLQDAEHRAAEEKVNSDTFRKQRDEAREEAATAGRNAKHYADRCIELEATVERLRTAITEALCWVSDGTGWSPAIRGAKCETAGEMFRTCNTAISSTPAANVAWIKAQALEELAAQVEYHPVLEYPLIGREQILLKANDLLNPSGQAEQNGSVLICVATETASA
jgi:hypothetical protein